MRLALALALALFLAAFALPSAARAQTIDDLRACGTVPTDTVRAWLTAWVRPLDHRQGVPDFYLSMLTDELTKRIRLPSPLPLRLLVVRPATPRGDRGGFALLGARGLYDVTLRRAAPPTATTVLSSLSPVLDSAVVGALEDALRADGLSTYPAGAVGDSVGLRLSLRTTDSLAADAQPLAAIRTTRARLDGVARPETHGFPYYPPQLRDKGVKGYVMVRFVVGPQGNIVPGTVHETEYSDLRLVGPARDHVFDLRWAPSRVKGCAIPTEVTMRVDFPPVMRFGR